jgi:hypothetical protein
MSPNYALILLFLSSVRKMIELNFFLRIKVFNLVSIVFQSEQNGDLVFDDMGLDDPLDDENPQLHNLLEAEDVMMQEPSTFGRVRSMLMGWFGGRDDDVASAAADSDEAAAADATHRVRRSLPLRKGLKGKRRKVKRQPGKQGRRRRLIDDDDDDSSGGDTLDGPKDLTDIFSGDNKPITRPQPPFTGKPCKFCTSQQFFQFLS